MIVLTKLDERMIVINADLIKTIEPTPDTLITLINGSTIYVRESIEDVVDKAVDHARRVHGFRVVG